MKKLSIVIGVTLALLVAITAQSSAQIINACVNKTNGELRIDNHCRKHETPISWNKVGPKGDKGETGPRGPAGVANGITKAVHGEVGLDGTVIQGTGFFTDYPQDFYCWLLPTFDRCSAAVHFDPPFPNGAVTCVVSSTYVPNVPEQPDLIFDITDANYQMLNLFFRVPHGSLPLVDASFTFICVQ